MSIEWPAGMMAPVEFVNSATDHYKDACHLRANNLHAAAAQADLNAHLCQLAPAIISIAESLAVIAKAVEQINDSGMRVCPWPLRKVVSGRRSMTSPIAGRPSAATHSLSTKMARSQNKMRFCCYCGHPLEEVPWTDEEDEETADVHDR